MHQKLPLSLSIAPLKLPTHSLRFHHGFLRKNAANFDSRVDLLFPTVKRAFGARLADILGFVTLGALLLAD